MPADLLVLRAARNAFLFVLLALVGVSSYQFATTGGLDPGVAIIWVVGAGGFYASKWYYRRGEAGATADADEAGATADADEAGATADAGEAPPVEE